MLVVVSEGWGWRRKGDEEGEREGKNTSGEDEEHEDRCEE